MYTYAKTTKTSIKVNKTYEGQSIEKKIYNIINNNEPITDGAPLNYTERKHGVQPEYNIRTDRWEIAVEAATTINKTHLAQRQDRIDAQWAKENPEAAAKKAADKAAKDKNGGAESTQGK